MIFTSRRRCFCNDQVDFSVLQQSEDKHVWIHSLISWLQLSLTCIVYSPSRNTSHLSEWSYGIVVFVLISETCDVIKAVTTFGCRRWLLSGQASMFYFRCDVNKVNTWYTISYFCVLFLTSELHTSFMFQLFNAIADLGENIRNSWFEYKVEKLTKVNKTHYEG